MNIKQFALSSTLAAVILGAPVAAARAQDAEPEFINVGSYAIAFPLGDTHDFVPNTSWFGANWEGQWRYKPKTSVGVSLGLQDFFNQSRGTTTFSSGAVTGQQSRELLLGTIMGIGRYYPGPTLGRGFYLGMGAGGQFAQQYYQLGVTNPIGRSAFHFAIAPELGVVTPIMEDLDVVFTARLTATTAAGNYLGGGARNFKFITLGVGMAER